MQKKLIKPLLLVLITITAMIAGGGGGYYWYTCQTSNIQYMTEVVSYRDIEDTILAGGTVHAQESVDVGSQVTGQVEHLYVNLGESVKKGQIIADIDATQQKNILKEEQITYKNLISQNSIRREQLKQAQAEFDSQKILYEGNVLSKIDFLKSQNALKIVTYELQASEVQLEQSRLKIDNATSNLKYTRIIAPIDGIVIAVVTKQGQTVNAAQSAPTIVKLAKIDTVQIKAKFSEADVPKLKTGMPAYFTILGMPNRRFDAILHSLELAPINTSTENNANQQGAVYYSGFLNVANPKHELFIGMTASVTVLVDTRRHVLSIPMTALGKSHDSQTYNVQVLDTNNSKAEPETRTIRIGLTNAVYAEVLSGLKEGEQVVISQSDGKLEDLTSHLNM